MGQAGKSSGRPGRKRGRRPGVRPTPRAGTPGESWLQGGRIRSDTVEELFGVARMLHVLAPWKVAHDGQVLRMDIPALGVDGACLSIIGKMGINTGVIIFPSLAGYLAFLAAAEESLKGSTDPHPDTGWLSLTYEPEEDLPAKVRHEIREHAWPLAGPRACPVVERVDPEGRPLILQEEDLHIVTACARSLGAFFIKHAGIFKGPNPEPVCESFFDENDLEVRITAPYDALPLFDLGDDIESGFTADDPQPARRPGPRVGRNDPCPCGSGHKYKNCHLRLDEQAREEAAQRHRLHDLDNDLVARIAVFASRRFGTDFTRALDEFADQAELDQLGEPWVIYDLPLDGRTPAEWYLEEQPEVLDAGERGWIEAQVSAWLSVWEVTDVEYGTSLTLRDLLTGQIRTVQEARGSRTLVLRDTILGRLVDFDGASLLCGVHSRPLPPVEADLVVERARRKLGRKSSVPIERLRDPGFGKYLLRAWDRAVSRLDRKLSQPPVLHNMDGDPLQLTTDTFQVQHGRQDTMVNSLAGWPDVVAHEDADGRDFVFEREPRSDGAGLETVVIGRAYFENGLLHVETNSLKRADALKERIEEDFGDHLQHKERRHHDPFAGGGLTGIPAGPARKTLEPASPELDERTRQYKQQYYADWIDQPLPALNGETPRAAAQSDEGRRAVDLLIKDMENSEHREPEATRFDFSDIRRKLGLG